MLEGIISVGEVANNISLVERTIIAEVFSSAIDDRTGRAVAYTMYYHGKGKESRCGRGRLLRKLKPYVARVCHAEYTYLNDLLPVLVSIHAFALPADSVQCLLCSSSSHSAQGVAGHCCKWLNRLAQLLWLSV